MLLILQNYSSHSVSRYILIGTGMSHVHLCIYTILFFPKIMLLLLLKTYQNLESYKNWFTRFVRYVGSKGKHILTCL